MTLNDILKIISEIVGQKEMEVFRRENIPAETAYLYVVSNGNHILQIGKTSGGKNSGRLVSLLRGARPAMHNKSFIVGLADAVLDEKNRFFIFRCPIGKDVSELEIKVHNKLGINTNSTSAVLIAGRPAGSISTVNKWLWDKFLNSDIYKNLSASEKQASQALYNLIDHEVVYVKRQSGSTQPYRSGDILNGNILKNANFLGYANLWQKMCDNYFQYTSYYLLDHTNYVKFLNNDDKEIVVHLQERKRTDVDDVIDVDIEISKAQLERAKKMIDTNEKERLKCKTADIQLETNHENYILIITRPLERGDKISEMLASINDEIIILNNLIKCDRSTSPIKYKTDFPSCYVQLSKTGYKNKGARWIDKD